MSIAGNSPFYYKGKKGKYWDPIMGLINSIMAGVFMEYDTVDTV